MQFIWINFVSCLFTEQRNTNDKTKHIHSCFATIQYVAEVVTAAPPTRPAGAPEERKPPSARRLCLKEIPGSPRTERPGNR